METSNSGAVSVSDLDGEHLEDLPNEVEELHALRDVSFEVSKGKVSEPHNRPVDREIHADEPNWVSRFTLKGNYWIMAISFPICLTTNSPYPQQGDRFRLPDFQPARTGHRTS
jgi:hypothetical protein